MIKYIFGDTYHHQHTIEANSLELAIKIFKTEVLYPEEFVNSKQVKERGQSNGRDELSYEGDHPYEFNTKNPTISIFLWKEKGENKKVGQVSLAECLDVDFGTLLPARKMLEAPKGSEAEGDSQLPVIGSQKELCSLGGKMEFRDKHMQLMLKKKELELMKDKLNEALEAMQNELTRKKRLLYAIETYMGINEEVYELAKGSKASEDEPLTVFQQVLYMDEEIGIWEDGGLDISSVDKFDEWITRNYSNFLHKPKSVCVFQVRRHAKDYVGGDTSLGSAFANAMMNEGNFNTYFLIRNGECLYRIWSDVSMSSRLFPTKQEFQEIMDRYESWGESNVRDKLEERHRQYMYGLIAIQGLVERTDVFGESLRGKVNLITGKFDPADVVLVRDAEPDHWLGDGKPSWRDYCEANRTTVKVGSRIMLTHRGFWNHKEEGWRLGSQRAPWPANEEIYVVEEMKTEEDKKKSGREWDIRIIYHPKDEIWPSLYSYIAPHERQKGVGFKLYLDEVLNYDEITLDDIDYYMKSRLERENYLDMLPVLHWLRKRKRQARDLEAEFVKLVAGQIGYCESQYGRIRHCIEWWKLKNKWKRALTVDEAKALRMVVAKLKSGTPIEFLRPRSHWKKQTIWQCVCGSGSWTTVDGDKPPAKYTCDSCKKKGDVRLKSGKMVVVEDEPEVVTCK